MKETGRHGPHTAAVRQERLAAELRANLKKRKAQARARAGGTDKAAEEAGVSGPGSAKEH